MVESINTCLTTWADEIIGERRILAKRMTVCLVSQYQFHVLGGGIKDGIVDIRNKTYSCRVFQLDQLICAHAITTCLTVRVDYRSLCSDFYTKESLAMDYASLEFYLKLPNQLHWYNPSPMMHVYPPVKAPPLGQCKEFRIPSGNKDVNLRTIRCGRCNELGHNCKRCKNRIASNRS